MTVIDTCRVAVVIPCYQVKNAILGVIATIPPEVERIFVIDDACPQGSGLHVQTQCADPRVQLLFNATNQGVGGAVMRGYHEALAQGFAIIVKIDGDGQMDGIQISRLTAPLRAGMADYAKGNRFHNLSALKRMPPLRLCCNIMLSFITKLSSGYWRSLDPTNGFTAITAQALRRLPLGTISRDYFFESDMLFHLSGIRATLIDIPLDAIYGEEHSGLTFRRNLWPFIKGHARNVTRRLARDYIRPASGGEPGHD